MISTENIKRLIKNARININPEIKKAALQELINELEKYKTVGSAGIKSNIWAIIAKSKITQIAVAAVIIIATSFFVMQPEQLEEIKTPQITQTAKSPVESLTMGSLNLAYRHGGMQAAEEQSLKALGMAAVANSNIKQLQEEFFKNNGI